MKRRLALSFTVLLFVATAHRLPAPIQEVPESPPPAPKQPSKPKPRLPTKEREPPRKPTPAKPKFGEFAGTWVGPVTVTFGSDIGLNGSGKSSRTLKISNDGTVYYGQSTDGRYTGEHNSRASLSSDGRTLIWSYQQTQQDGTVRATYSLRLVGANTAGYQENGSFTGQANMTGKTFGILTKQR
jgi:hypothetical protein